MEATIIGDDASEWITINGVKPDLAGYVFVFTRYSGETREEAEAYREGYGQSVDAVPNWVEVVEYRRKHVIILTEI